MSDRDQAMLSTFNFEVLIGDNPQGGVEGLTRAASFAEVTGLEVQLETRQLREGGYNRGVRRLVESTTPGTLVFRRGMTDDAAFWKWIQRCFHGPYPLPYVHGEVHVYRADRDQDPQIWQFESGIATRVTAASLDARGSGEIPIEELHIEHEALLREVGDG